MLALCLWLMAAASDRVEGLTGSESWSLLAKAPPATEDVRWIEGRIVVGPTGQGLPGARVEVFTEDFAEPQRIILRLDETTTGVDGSFRVRGRVGTVIGEKIRVSAAGFGSLLLPANDFDDVAVALDEPVARRLRLTDLEGRPIEGGELRLRQSCVHSPATEVFRSDAAGELLLRGPAIDHWVDFEAAADGYGLVTGDLDELLHRPDADGVVELPLPRRPVIDLVVLDSEGRPASGRRVAFEHSPVVTSWIGPDGQARFGSVAYLREGVVRFVDPRGEQHLTALWVPPGEAVTLREDADAFDPPAGWRGPSFEIVQPEGLPSEKWKWPLVRVIHEAGWIAEGFGSHLLPPGEIEVLVGADFSGWKPYRSKTVLEGSPRFEPRPEREPVLTVSLPAQQLRRLHVQAGDDSVSLDYEQLRERVVEVPVPSDRPIVVLAETVNGERRRLERTGIAEDTEVSLRESSLIIRPGYDPMLSPTCHLDLDVRDRSGAVLPIEKLTVTGPDGSEDVTPETSEDVVRLELAANQPFTIEISSSGYGRARLTGTAMGHGETMHRRARMRREATVVLTGNVVGARAAGLSTEPSDDGFRAELAAGPCLVMVETREGDRIGIRLDLEEGDLRALHVR
ncbi:MAG: carboxypeptidase-like regulatory domain-containing protein [Planctomycetota bacterium]